MEIIGVVFTHEFIMNEIENDYFYLVLNDIYFWFLIFKLFFKN
ncbi:hypothetical protein AVENLUH5627_02575 [Acinetobacter venetianus]|uniref:Uncharacterized protein n=1 Tax=Acinetobacter venetianus TaxID=52133 RepID=A0A150HMF8_9GAMM|nr:hypothetical protein AVENLUH5627_02575 [Acinetobacter venetianus]